MAQYNKTANSYLTNNQTIHEVMMVSDVDGNIWDPTDAGKPTTIAFSSNTLLANGESYNSGVISLLGYTQVQTDILSDVDGTILIEFCGNATGTDVVRTLTIPYDASTGYQMFSAPAFSPSVKYTFTASESGQTDFYFDTKLFNQALSPQLLRADAFISPSMSASLTRSVIVGRTDGNQYLNVPVTTEGHLEVALEHPRLPFGSIHTEELTPVFQTDAVYGINPWEVETTNGLAFDPGPTPGNNSATTSGENNLFTCSTGNTAFSFSSIQSRKRLRYRPGQGSIVRYTALFSTPAASSILVAGCGSGEAGYFFGYNGTSFGVLHSTGGVREIQTFTVSAATSSGGTATFRLNGLDYEVTLATSATTILTANDIASNTFPGWSVEARGSTVIFLANSVGNKTGTFSFTLGTAVGTAGSFAETLQGANATDTWIAQTDWNGDKCDGTGKTGFTLDPSKGNLYEITIAYLGFGPIEFKIMIPSGTRNNSLWVTVHTLNYPNTSTAVHTSQPSFPFTMSAYSAGSTSNVSVSCGSFAGFLEGAFIRQGPRSSFSATSTAVTSGGTYYTLISIRNDLIHAHSPTSERANQSVVYPLSFGGAHDDATPVLFYLIRDASLVGANWQRWSESSCIYYDVSATTCTFDENSQLVQILPVSQSGSILIPLEDLTTLQPGETFTIAAQTVTGTSTWTIASLNTREDQ